MDAFSWVRAVRLSRTGPLQGNHPARGYAVRLAVAWKGDPGPGKRGEVRIAGVQAGCGASVSGGESGTGASEGPISGVKSGTAEGQTESNQK